MSRPQLARCKEWRPIIKKALQAGWSVIRTPNNHLKFTAPSGANVYSGSNRSDHRAIHNLKAQLRRQGLTI